MSSKRHFVHSIEILESRIAPAAVTFSFIDKNGATVKITSSKGSVGDLQAAVGPLSAGVATGVFSLTLGTKFQGADLTITAGTATDSIFTQLGFLDAHTIDLGNVTIDGELDRILAGDTNSATPALKTITVGSWGNATAPTGTELDSLVIGAIGTVAVKGDFTGGLLRVLGSDSDQMIPSASHSVPAVNSTDAQGKIGALMIGGSLVGTARDNGGHILASGDITRISIGGSVTGFLSGKIPGITNTSSDLSGRIFSGGAIGSLLIGTDATDGNLSGGDGIDSGQIGSVAGIGSVTVKGKIQGGLGSESGTIGAGGSINTVLVKRNIVGGAGFNSGAIGSFVQLGTVNVLGDLVGGSGYKSGEIVSKGTITSVTVNNLRGGSNFESGAIGSLKGLGTVVVKGDIVAGTGDRSGFISTQEEPVSDFIVVRGTLIPDPAAANAPIGSVTVGGSIIADFDSESGAGYRAGGILASGKLGPVVVTGAVHGGTGEESGRIASSSSIASVKIGGDLSGSDGLNSGTISSALNLGPVTIGGSLEGGAGSDSGSVSSDSTITSVSVGGETRGGGGDGSGSIQSTGNLGPVQIGTNPLANSRSLIGGAGEHSGAVVSGGKLAKIDVFGSLLGDAGPSSGSIETLGVGPFGDMGPVFIAGSLIGGFGSTAATDSGQIASGGKIASITIGDPKSTDAESGSVTGGIAAGSGTISSEGDLGPVKIKLNLEGGTGDESGKITSGGKLAALTVGGSIIGGIGSYGTTSGSGDQLGQVFATGDIASVTVTGSVTGDPFDDNGGDYAAQIRGASLGTVKIGGAISGGHGAHSGGFFAQKNIGSVTVQNLYGGRGEGSGFISAEGDIGSVKINGSLTGGGGSGAGYVAAGGTLAAVETAFLTGDVESGRPRISAGKAITAVTIDESSSFGDILAGYDTRGLAVNPDAQIGTVQIGKGTGPGNMTGTNIVAGIDAGGDGFFGTYNDRVISGTGSPGIFSKIASVIVKGSILNTSNPYDTYGIVAQNLVSLKVGGAQLALKTNALNDFYHTVSDTSDTVYGEKPLVE